MNSSRRGFLALAGSVPVAALAFGGIAQGATCYDPNTLSLTQKNRRRSLGYVEPSTDPSKKCGACAFFTATTAGCGTCALLSAGPVSAGAVCRSFAARGK